MLYKVWSGFTKNLRHLLVSKDKPVRIPRIGTFDRIRDKEAGVFQFGFQPSTELCLAVCNEEAAENPGSESRKTNLLDW